MGLSRGTDVYINDVDTLLDFAFSKFNNYAEIVCPCKKCNNILWQPLETIREHLILYNLKKYYINWVHHERYYFFLLEKQVTEVTCGRKRGEGERLGVSADHMHEMLNDVFIGTNLIMIISIILQWMMMHLNAMVVLKMQMK